MFKTRQPSAAAPVSNPPTVEWVRQRAKHRLLGVFVLVLAGVLLFPMLFDSQPRPIPVDIAIEIPSKQTAPPLLATPAEGRQAPDGLPAASASAAPSDGRSTGDAAVVREEMVGGSEAALRVQEASQQPPPNGRTVPAQASAAGATPAPVAPAPAAAPQPRPQVASAPATPSAPPAPPAPLAAPAPSAKEAEAARVRALLEGRPVASVKPAAQAAEAPAGQRFIVQVGAFAESTRAQQVRNNLERVGLKTYTHVADTPQGKRIRVRLGPFATRAEAEKAAAKAKTTGVPAAILTL
jgi:DedD protein